MSGGPLEHLRRQIPGNVWPVMAGGPAAGTLAMQYHLRRSERLEPEVLQRNQFVQLGELLGHAARQVPFYRKRFRSWHPGAALTPELWAELPILSRSEVQAAGASLRSRQTPPQHGAVHTLQTSGSTGMPVQVAQTDLVRFYLEAITLRDHLWHERDFATRLAAIRPQVAAPPGTPEVLPGWGRTTDVGFVTGQSFGMNIRTDVGAQADWLLELDPEYLLTMPTNLVALIHRFIAKGRCPQRLREVRSYGEVVDDEARRLCREVLGVPLTDMYSAQEVGYLALQCPGHEHYHLQSEVALVEVLDAAGRPCGPGEVGRVVVTPLHNYATPLIRYEIGDYAEVGEPCACGRSLPVIRRILGRARNMLVLPDGSSHYPNFPAALWTAIAPVRQFQLEQLDLERVVVRLVVARPLAVEEERALAAMLQERFRHPFSISFEYLERIERSAGGKYEDFISRVPLSG